MTQPEVRINTRPVLRSHCHACGSPYSPDQVQPKVHDRRCSECGTVSWLNATGVAVMLQPVYRKAGSTPRLELGLLLGQRGIEPMMGGWCLPGGFTSPEDPSYEMAAAREQDEEVDLGRLLPYTAYPPRLLMSLPGDAGQILAFSVSGFVLPEQWLEDHRPCQECPRVRAAWESEELCFGSHSQAMAAWFVRQREQVPTGKLLQA